MRAATLMRAAYYRPVAGGSPAILAHLSHLATKFSKIDSRAAATACQKGSPPASEEDCCNFSANLYKWTKLHIPGVSACLGGLTGRTVRVWQKFRRTHPAAGTTAGTMSAVGCSHSSARASLSIFFP